ncbi:hypothetical protein JRO89_XS04G0216200 [Xanthoceras sorbifolium]|uniref:C2H2-type domain-containing protein n=1 Tax=Xanthoceras sorbifolium TaxID=99658 RepID=A0ABQ8I6D9_9ROSI|nr:hypothetical protein JRO89_XS04G0216200 [Xanthoceras sorbifolium]
MRTTPFDSVNSVITPMNHVLMSLGNNSGYVPCTVPIQQYQAAAMHPVMSYPVPCMPSHILNGALPLQPPVFPPPSSHASNQQLNCTPHSDLISSLLSKGFISQPNQPQPPSQSATQSGIVSSLLNNLILRAKEQTYAQESIGLEFDRAKEQTSADDSIGLEFDPAKLKVRHESGIRALYADLPKQCTTCGMRFKSQEEHSLHMDWHVRKNRAAKSNKPKQMHSRNFFLTSGLWLTAAEAIGTDKAPAFFATDDDKEEKKPEKAVFADEDQKACPLCMEPFDEYFSNETDDWMYRGTAYFKVPKESKSKLHRSLIGRIVHAKCMQ